MRKIERIAIVGAGSVGGMYSSFFYKAFRDDFSLIATGERSERLRKNGITVNGETLFPKITSTADTAIDLLLICVKNYDLKHAIENITPIINKNTIILPILNGITATEECRRAFPENKVLYGITMRTDAERKNGETCFSVTGELQFGEAENDIDNLSECVLSVKDCLDRANLKNRVYENMVYMLWRKWMINIGSNQVSMLAEAKFKYFGSIPEIQEAVRMAITEIYEISKKAGSGLKEEDIDETVITLINYPPEKKSSMLQDFEAHRRTEIDYFAGHVVELGIKYGVPTPVNTILYKLIKAREKIYLKNILLQNRRNTND